MEIKEETGRRAREREGEERRIGKKGRREREEGRRAKK